MLDSSSDSYSLLNSILVRTSSTIFKYYELKSLESDNRTTLVLSNTRELDRELFYKLVYLI